MDANQINQLRINLQKKKDENDQTTLKYLTLIKEAFTKNSKINMLPTTQELLNEAEYIDIRKALIAYTQNPDSLEEYQKEFLDTISSEYDDNGDGRNCSTSTCTTCSSRCDTTDIEDIGKSSRT